MTIVNHNHPAPNAALFATRAKIAYWFHDNTDPRLGGVRFDIANLTFGDFPVVGLEQEAWQVSAAGLNPDAPKPGLGFELEELVYGMTSHATTTEVVFGRDGRSYMLHGRIVERLLRYEPTGESNEDADLTPDYSPLWAINAAHTSSDESARRVAFTEAWENATNIKEKAEALHEYFGVSEIGGGSMLMRALMVNDTTREGFQIIPTIESWLAQGGRADLSAEGILKVVANWPTE